MAPLTRAGDTSPPFPDSLCHSCAAPPRYVVSDRGTVFIHCPVLARYPPQPVAACDAYRPRGAGGPAGDEAGRDAEGS